MDCTVKRALTLHLPFHQHTDPDTNIFPTRHVSIELERYDVFKFLRVDQLSALNNDSRVNRVDLSLERSVQVEFKRVTQNTGFDPVLGILYNTTVLSANSTTTQVLERRFWSSLPASVGTFWGKHLPTERWIKGVGQSTFTRAWVQH